MLKQQLRTAAITVLPLTLTAAALWTTKAAYEVYVFDDLGFAKSAAFVLMVLIHLFAPTWAGTRPRWTSAAFAQMCLVAVNDVLYVQLVLTTPHGMGGVSKCGMGGLVLCMAVLAGFVVYVPIALINARSLHGKLREQNGDNSSRACADG